MNLNDIEYLATVAAHRHVGRAAEALGLTQPALTRAIARLEALAGMPLFERHPKGVVLTPAGEAFLRRAERIRMEYDDALSEMHQMKTGELGILRVGLTPTLDTERLMGVVRRLLVERPAARIHLTERLMHYLVQMLLDGELDAIVVPSPQPLPPELEATPLYDDVLHVVADAGHPLQQRRSLEMADLVDQPWLLPPPDTRMRRELERVVQQAGLPALNVRVEAAASGINTLRLVTGTPMLTLGSQWSMAAMAGIGLRPLPIALPALRRRIGLLTRRHAFISPLAQRLREVLVEEYAAA